MDTLPHQNGHLEKFNILGWLPLVIFILPLGYKVTCLPSSLLRANADRAPLSYQSPCLSIDCSAGTMIGSRGVSSV